MLNYKETDKYKECQKCDNFNKEDNICEKCSCYLPVKVIFPLSKCPLGKWTQ